MRFIFRADASPEIGSGHVMRLSAVAEEAISRGIECIFVGSLGGVEWLRERIFQLGFSSIISENLFKSDPLSDVLVLDSYIFNPDNNWFNRKHWKQIISFADEMTPDYSADLIIHPGLNSSWFKGDRSNFLSGPNYIPLRKTIGKIDRDFKHELQNIVVFGGGTDGFNFGGFVAELLRPISGFSKVLFFAKNKFAIEEMDPRFHVIDFGMELDDQLKSADLVLTTASTSSLEVMARGIPLGVGCAVSNQLGYYDIFTELQLASPIGNRVATGSWVPNVGELSKLIHDVQYRGNLIRNGSNLIDFKGSLRIVDAILDSSV